MQRKINGKVFEPIKNVVGAIINDCLDDNTRGRQCFALGSFLEKGVQAFVGVKTDLEATGNIVDLAAASHSDAVILWNVAHRDGEAKKFGNGTPFCWTEFTKKTGEKIIGFGTVDGFALSLPKKFGIFKSINLLDTSEAAEAMGKAGFMTSDEIRRAYSSQHRSLDFAPFAAAFILAGGQLPSSIIPIAQIPDCPDIIWWVDNFGNCKTSIVPLNPADFSSNIENAMNVRGEYLASFRHLSQVPDGWAAVDIGSSGIDGIECLEIVVQGGSAAKRFNLKVGQMLSEITKKEKINNSSRSRWFSFLKRSGVPGNS